MSKIKIIYDETCSWEKDYIRELFNKIDYDIIYVKPTILLNGLSKEYEIIGNNTLVFSSNAYTYDEILRIVVRIKPVIIVHLSDEFGTRREYTQLASHTQLLLHQYNFTSYPYNKYDNIIQIPLGYMTGTFSGKNALDTKLKPLLKRKYKWSFIGNIKADRVELISKFSKTNYERFIGNNIAPSDMFNIYNDTVFIPNGRGNVRIDCFRIYEAILSGCVPVIVCDKNEFNETFHYNNDIPPFIFEETWDDAVNKCTYLLNNEKELVTIQTKNYNWLQQKMKSIQSVILSILRHSSIPMYTNITSYLKSKGFNDDIEGNSGQNPQQTQDLINLTNVSNITVMEIGFNAGHSAETFLRNNKNLNLTSFDLGSHEYVKHAKEYIDFVYPNRHTLILGDSRKTVPKYVQNNKNTKFDFIFIDGAHDYEIAKVDMENCFQLAHKYTILSLHDTMFRQEWMASRTIGPTRTWIEHLQQNKIVEIKRKDYSHGRGMSWGKYIL